MASTKEVVFRFVFKWSLSIYYGFRVSIEIIYDIIKKGPSNYFHQKSRDARPECMNDPSIGEHGYAQLTKAGIQLHYVASGSETNPLMLFIHGFPECWYTWRYQMRTFQKDYRVVAVDLRGYGESDHPSGALNYTRQIIVDDIRELIEELGYSSCVLVAHDWGGLISWIVATQYPDIVDKMIIMNVAHPKCLTKYIQSHFSQLQKCWYLFFFQLPYLPEMYIKGCDFNFLNTCYMSEHLGIKTPGMFTADDLEAIKYTFSCAGTTTAAINYYRAPVQVDSVIPKKITAPTLIIWGDQDSTLEIGINEGTEKYVENFTLKVVEGASHWVQQDYPQEVDRLMNEFLKKED